jgi:hypothetical protein
MKLRLFFKMVRDYFKYSHDAELHGFAIGFNSFVNREKDLHILMLDYDTDDFKKVRESVCELIDFWNLSDAYIFSTKKGFHVFFYFDIMPYARSRMIINYAKYVDPLYKHISRFYNHKTLRAAGKYKDHDIRFKKVIKGKRNPSLEELELGELKAKEHLQLLGLHIILKKERLK